MTHQHRKTRALDSHPPARAAGFRGERLEELLREELNALLEIEISDPVLENARITRVEMSRDGSRARAWFIVTRAALAPPSDAHATKVRAAFERAAGFLRGQLCDVLPLKRFPDLTFRHDPVAPPSLGVPPLSGPASAAEEN